MSGQLECDVTGQQFWGWSTDPCNTDRRQQIQQKIREDEFNSTDNSGKSENYVQFHTLLLATYLTIVTKNVKKICNTGNLKRNTSFIVGTFFFVNFLVRKLWETRPQFNTTYASEGFQECFNESQSCCKTYINIFKIYFQPGVYTFNLMCTLIEVNYYLILSNLLLQ